MEFFLEIHIEKQSVKKSDFSDLTSLILVCVSMLQL